MFILSKENFYLVVFTLFSPLFRRFIGAFTFCFFSLSSFTAFALLSDYLSSSEIKLLNKVCIFSVSLTEFFSLASFTLFVLLFYALIRSNVVFFNFISLSPQFLSPVKYRLITIKIFANVTKSFPLRCQRHRQQLASRRLW